MFKVVLRSTEAIDIVVRHYFEEDGIKMTISGELSFEEETMSRATEIFAMLLERNLVSAENVEFVATVSPEQLVEKQEESNQPVDSHIISECEGKSIKERVYDFICELYPKKVTIKDVSVKLGLKYQSASTAILKLYKQGKVEKDAKKRYFKKVSAPEMVEKVVSAGAEKSSVNEEMQTGASNNSATEQTETTATQGKSTNTEGDEHKSEETQSEQPEEKVEELTKPKKHAEEKNAELTAKEELPEYTSIEKAKTMVEAFSKEKYQEILEYIFFFRKRNFEVEKIRSKFNQESELVANVIKILAEKSIIIFDEKLPPEGRYVIQSMWRMYAILLNSKAPMEEGALRTAVEIGTSDFNKLMEQAFNDGIVEKTEEKRVTRYNAVTEF